MPYRSRKQQRYFHVLKDKGKISPEVVKEWDEKSKGKKLPKYVKKHKKSHYILEMLKYAEELDKNKKYKDADNITDLAEMSLSDQKNYIGSKQAEALFAFMGWLTGRDERSGPFSSHDNAASAAELVGRFCESQGWDIIPERDTGDPKDFNWTDDLKPYPEDDKPVYSTEEILEYGKGTDNKKIAKLLNKTETHVSIPKEYKDKFEGVSVAKDKKGYFCYTHRCRSDSYKSLIAIPKSVVDYIESTG